MPPKHKEMAKKAILQVNRPAISDSTLLYVPSNAIEGYQERIETGIDWTLVELAARHHRQLCLRGNITKVTFTEALQNKINKSILKAFLNEQSNLSLEEQWELLLPITLWDNEKFANEESKICFRSYNNITDDMVKLIKRAVQLGDRKVLRQELKLVPVLRLNDAQLTELDSGLLEFQKLVTLNLCGNFLNDFDSSCIPRGVKILELQANCIRNIKTFSEYLPSNLSYLGLARNLLNDDNIESLLSIPNITVLDLSDNDIYNLEEILNILVRLPNLSALFLAGNPCSGAITTFHVELELPLLDTTRRNFLMFRQNESLIERLPLPEDEEWPVSNTTSKVIDSKIAIDSEASAHDSDIYKCLTTKNSREIYHFTTFESNRIQWNKVMNFQEPAVRIFCPDLFALRNTFRTVVTIRLIYSMTMTSKQNKPEKKSAHSLKQAVEQRVTLATIKCSLRRPDWSQNSQHFHWDNSLGTNEAIHWGEGDLSVLQYSQAPVKITKGKTETDVGSLKQQIPENLTCHFGFGIDTLRI
ncbi:uncharacterized protein LOC113517096 isoform X2 [Galleria mellonella]|uniref:Uncharacterized protein LOC113517096 isoform X2 n=1 Tax=Galleria mellonella TaxID=7137 RepID=A0A6J3BTV7_GALME|nr:uncharacterized protein LOC113517096 isoform X2 [Galleria mellonella]